MKLLNDTSLQRIKQQDIQDLSKEFKEIPEKISSNIVHEDQIKLFQRYNQDLLRSGYSDKRSLFIYDFQKCRLTDLIWRFLDKFPVFNPYNKAIIGWDIIQIIALFVLLFSYPLIFSIDAIFDKKIEIIFSAIVLADMIIRLNIGFFEMDTFIISKQKIFKRYVKEEFLYDFIGNISIIYFFVSQTHEQPWILLILAKSQTIRKLLINVEEIFFHNFQIRNWLKLLKLIFTIAFFSHLFACGWVLMGQQDYPQTWIKKANIQHEEWSLFFSLVTMITVGYGDITPTNYSETVFVSCVMMLACGMFGYSLNQIGTIFNEAFRSQERVRENIAIMSIYMKKKKISTPLQFKIRQYLQFYWNQNKVEEQEKEQEIKGILSSQLQEELILDENKLVLREARILVDNFSESVMKKAAQLIKQQNCTPEEVIFQEGESYDQNLYFIEEGSCEIFIEGNDRKQNLQEIQCGQYFGSWSFFTGFSRSCSIRSKGFCTLLFINRQEFIDICKQSEEDFEKFCFIRDKMIFEEDYQCIESSCFCCKQYSHQLYDCDILHYSDKKQCLHNIKQDNRTIHRFRMEYKKKSKKKFKSLIRMQGIQSLQQKYINENQFEIQQYESDNFLTLIANMYGNEKYDEQDSFLQNEDDSPFLIDDTPKMIQQVGQQSTVRWSNNNNQGMNRQESFQSFKKSHSQTNINSNNQNTNIQQQQQQQHPSQQQQPQEFLRQSSHTSQFDEQLVSFSINGNSFPAVEPNYFYSQHQSQQTERSKKLSGQQSPIKHQEDNFFNKIPLIPLSEIQPADNQKTSGPIISTILAINSNVNNSGHPSKIIKSNPSNLSPRESNKFDRQRSNNTMKTHSKIDIRSRNNSGVSSYSNLSPINKKSQMFFNRISNNFIEFSEQEQYQKISERHSIKNHDDKIIIIEQLMPGAEDIQDSSEQHFKDTVIQKQLSQSSSNLQKLLPTTRQNSSIKVTSISNKGTNMLSALLKLKKFSRKVKSKFQEAEKELQKSNTNNQTLKSKLSKVGGGSSPTRKNSFGQMFDLQQHPSEMFFFLMKHRNISQYSLTQQIIDEGFEKMHQYTHYYPLSNSDIIIRLITLSHEEKVKHYKRILEIQKNEINRGRRHQNSITRLKQKYQNEQHTLDNTPNAKNLDESKIHNNELFINLEMESFSSLYGQKNIANLKQQFSQFVNSSSHKAKKNSIVNNSENIIESNNEIKLNKQSFSILDSPSPLPSATPMLQQSSLSATSSPTPLQRLKQGTKSKYYIPPIQEIEEQIKDMEKDLNSQSFCRDPSNSINITIPNLSVNNQLFKDYLTEI